MGEPHQPPDTELVRALSRLVLTYGAAVASTLLDMQVASETVQEYALRFTAPDLPTVHTLHGDSEQDARLHFAQFHPPTQPPPRGTSSLGPYQAVALVRRTVHHTAWETLSIHTRGHDEDAEETHPPRTPPPTHRPGGHHGADG